MKWHIPQPTKFDSVNNMASLGCEECPYCFLVGTTELLEMEVHVSTTLTVIQFDSTRHFQLLAPGSQLWVLYKQSKILLPVKAPPHNLNVPAARLFTQEEVQ